MRLVRHLLPAATLVLPALSIMACDETSSTPGGSDASTTRDGGAVDAYAAADATAQRDATADSSASAIRCTQAEFDAPCGMQGGDCSAPQIVQIDIAFPTVAAPTQYTNNCVKVKTGTVIDFAGDFTLHPLRPKGGDTPTPIPTQTTNPPNGTSGMPELLLTMTTPGTYGFECMNHPTVMFGAIQVVP